MPILEISLLLQVGEIIGGWNTLFIVIITAFLGAHLVRQQGLSTFMQAQSKMQQGQVPGQEMAEGLLLLIAGVLLVTPGFVTDGIGFLFTLPITRPIIAKYLMSNLIQQASVHTAQQPFQFHQQSQHHYQQQYQRSSQQQDDIIEGEYRRTDHEQLSSNQPANSDNSNNTNNSEKH